MVKYYLELIEINGGTFDPNPPQRMMVYVSSKEEAIEKKTLLLPLFGDKIVKCMFVECRHEEGESCISENI